MIYIYRYKSINIYYYNIINYIYVSKLNLNKLKKNNSVFNRVIFENILSTQLIIIKSINYSGARIKIYEIIINLSLNFFV